MFIKLRWEAVVHFVDIGVIVDHHCFKLSFHKSKYIIPVFWVLVSVYLPVYLTCILGANFCLTYLYFGASFCLTYLYFGC
jgi:hypothetical protein